MKPEIVSLLFQLFALTRVSFTARILALYPFPSISHQNVLLPCLNELASRGHEIVYYSNLHNRNIHPSVTFREITAVTISDFDNKDETISRRQPIALTVDVYRYELALTRLVLETPAFQSLIHSNETFDIVMHEPFVAGEFTAAFVHKFNALSVVYTALADSSWLNVNAGLPDNPAYMVDWKGSTTDRMNFYERAMNTVELWVTTGLSYYYVNKMQDIVHEYMNYTGWESRPHLTQLIVDNALILVNSHHSIGYNFPKAPHVKEIGGIHVSSVNPLPKNFAKFLDEASEGFIYFSLGSIIDTKSPQILNLINHLLNALGNVKLKALCKLHVDSSIVLPDNVGIAPWIPQQGVLGHKNIKLFISHGGLQSMFEAVHHGVPMLIIPLVTDELKNAQQAVSGGFGKSIELSAVTNSSLSTMINEMIKDPNYKSEAMRRSNLLKDRPLTPLNEAVYWIEYVLRNGKSLQPSSLRLSFIQLHQLDVMAFISTVAAVFVVAGVRISRFLLSLLRTGTKQVVARKKRQ